MTTNDDLREEIAELNAKLRMSREVNAQLREEREVMRTLAVDASRTATKALERIQEMEPVIKATQSAYQAYLSSERYCLPDGLLDAIEAYQQVEKRRS